jgi:hypothetical protein
MLCMLPTVSLIVDESLAGVELAASLPIDQVLWLLARGYHADTPNLPHPSPQWRYRQRRLRHHQKAPRWGEVCC